MHRTLPRILSFAAVTAALALPGAAQAAIKTVDYRVVIDGSADYNRADVDADTSAQHDEAVGFRTTIPKLTFHGNVSEDSTGALGTASVTRGSYVITGPSAQVRCNSHAISDVNGGGLDATYGQDRTVFAARVIDSFTVAVGDCTVPGMGTWHLPVTSGGAEVGIGVFDGSFSVPHSRIGEATMTFPLKGEVTGAECPMHHALTALCSLTWDATVTFTRTGEGEESEEVEPVPIVPDPVPGQPPVDPDDDLLVPLVAKAKLTADLSRASLPFTCAASCKGTLTAKAGSRTLGKKRFSLRAGRTGRPAVRFDRADRRAIKRAGKVKLTVKATGGGETVRRTVTLRVGKK